MMNDSDACPKAFTMAIFEGAPRPPADEESRCVVCGETADRMLRFADFTRLQPLEMRWCERCWRQSLESGRLANPLQHLGMNNSVSPAYLVSELSLTELPLPEALERLYTACDQLKGGCIRCCGSSDLPLVGPVRIKSQPLGSTLDSMLGPVGLKWDICHGVLLIAASSDEIEKLKQKELGPDEQSGPK
ncbi:MAG TPA: hypothetical protein VM223_24175 [Planctomycetota bacterium]|nr:hypothetical protein [Planctomycetota bacterium]